MYCKRKPATPANHGLGKIRYLIGLSRILCPLSTRGARVIQVLASNFLLDLQLCAFQPPGHFTSMGFEHELVVVDYPAHAVVPLDIFVSKTQVSVNHLMKFSKGISKFIKV